MTPRQTAWLRRSVILALGCAVAGLLSGCVYLRLLSLKRQFADFNQHFTLQTEDGLLLVAHQPVLLTGDIRWLGVPPEKTNHAGDSEKWHVRWTKRLPPGVRESADYDLQIDLAFHDNKLASVHIPERYFGQISKPFLVDLMRGLGGAAVDRKKRALEASFNGDGAKPPEGRPTLDSVSDLLGVPTERHRRGQQVTLRYRYIPVAPAREKAGNFDVVLTFDTASGELQSMQGRTPVGRMSFNFAASTPSS